MLTDCPVGTVALVPHQHHNGGLIRVALSLVDPVVADRVEGILVRQIEDQIHRMRICASLMVTFVVSVDNGTKPFLPRRIPDLQLHDLAINCHRLEPEIDPDCYHVVLVELVVGKPQQQGRLAHRTIAHHHELVLVVVLLFAPLLHPIFLN